MYLAHFGLNQSPFGITPNPSFFFSGSKRGEILDALLYAVVNGEGIVKVTGEVGCGKTMLCRMLEDMLPHNVEVLYLVNPTLTREQVLYTIAGELNLTTEGKRVDEIIRMLHSDLIAKHVAGKQVVLLVEEAQAMPLDTLEEIRLFSNLETAHHKLMQIVLFGQPELDEHLNLACMRQLKERITHSFKVPPLTTTDIPEYLMFRLRTAGYRGPDVFNQSAIKLIGKVSEGIIRRVSILADKALLAAFAENSHAIEPRHVKAAIADSEFPKDALHTVTPKRLAITLGALLLVGIIGAWYVSHPKAVTVNATPLSEPPAKTLPSQVNTSLPSPTASSRSLPATSIAARADSPYAQALATNSRASTSAADQTSIEQRLQMTQAWLNRKSPDRYSVQVTLISPGTPAEVVRTLQKIDSEIGLDGVYVYASRRHSNKYFGILYGSYVTRVEAMEKVALFTKQWGYHPQLRTLGGIKKEIARADKPD